MLSPSTPPSVLSHHIGAVRPTGGCRRRLRDSYRGAQNSRDIVWMSLVATTMAVLSDIKGPSTPRHNHHAHCIGSSLPTTALVNGGADCLSSSRCWQL